MPAYVAVERLRRPAIRPGTIARRSEPHAAGDDPAIILPSSPGCRREPGRIGTWIEDARVAWAETTFYLFSPEGWR